MALMSFFARSDAIHPNVAIAIPTPTQEAQKENTVFVNGTAYTYDYFTVTDPATLSLIPNFSKKEDAKKLFDENGCTSAINGGFYDTANKPLGEFQVNGTYYSGQIQSDLVNGFVWAVASDSAMISSDLPYASYRYAMQTGPILLFDGNVMPLSIHNDVGARRMIAAKNMENQLVFLAIYNGDSVFDGPKLADVPQIVQTISAKEHLNIADAINLDGGDASVFYSAKTSLSELSPVGSLFCVQ